MFSKTCQYAIRAVLYLSVHTDEKNKIGVEEISEGLDVPKHFLAKILQQLTRHKLASSSKGRNGGFYLSDENKKASLLAVIQTIDGKELFSSCVLGLPNCSDHNPCSLHTQALAYRREMMRVLDNKTIAQLAKKIDNKNFKI